MRVAARPRTCATRASSSIARASSISRTSRLCARQLGVRKSGCDGHTSRHVSPFSLGSRSPNSSSIHPRSVPSSVGVSSLSSLSARPGGSRPMRSLSACALRVTSSPAPPATSVSKAPSGLMRCSISETCSAPLASAASSGTGSTHTSSSHACVSWPRASRKLSLKLSGRSATAGVRSCRTHCAAHGKGAETVHAKGEPATATPPCITLMAHRPAVVGLYVTV